jgi:hypothetical protein
MGLLDDAIREHLDLKRRRGADPAEVERAEREALGPVRRGPEAPEQADPGLEGPDLEEPLAYDHEAEEQWEEPYDDEDDGFAMQETAHSQPFDLDEPRLAEEPPSRAAAPPADFVDFDEDEPLPASEERFERFDDPEQGTRGAPPAPHPAPEPEPETHEYRGGETVEYEVEAALDQEERDKHADDPLEETPDFLQDTPDHDRLWFEQRPPRDFDFDG